MGSTVAVWSGLVPCQELVVLPGHDPVVQLLGRVGPHIEECEYIHQGLLQVSPKAVRVLRRQRQRWISVDISLTSRAHSDVHTAASRCTDRHPGIGGWIRGHTRGLPGTKSSLPCQWALAGPACQVRSNGEKTEQDLGCWNFLCLLLDSLILGPPQCHRESE